MTFIKLSYRAEEKPQVFDGRVACALTPVRPTRAEREEEKRSDGGAPRAAGDVRRAQLTAAAVHAQRARARGRHGDVRRHPPRLADTQRMSVVHAATVSSSMKWPALAEAGARAHEKTLRSRRTAVSRRTRHLRSAWRARVVSQEALGRRWARRRTPGTSCRATSPDAFAQISARTDWRLSPPRTRRRGWRRRSEPRARRRAARRAADPATRRDRDPQAVAETLPTDTAGEGSSEKAPSRRGSVATRRHLRPAREEALPDELDESVL